MGRLQAMILVLLVPATLTLLALVLVVADGLERRSSVFLVRSSLRSPVSYELTEAIIAANLAPRLEAAGLGRDHLEYHEPTSEPDHEVEEHTAPALGALRVSGA
jgi:hypothetical protein